MLCCMEDPLRSKNSSKILESVREPDASSTVPDKLPIELSGDLESRKKLGHVSDDVTGDDILSSLDFEKLEEIMEDFEDVKDGGDVALSERSGRKRHHQGLAKTVKKGWVTIRHGGKGSDVAVKEEDEEDSDKFFLL